MLNICSVNVSFQKAPAYIRHMSLTYRLSVGVRNCGSTVLKTGFKNLEKLLYLCILWFWILITASIIINYKRL